MAVYFIQYGETGPIKIGSTSDSVESRRANLQTGTPTTLNIRAVMDGDVSEERALHRRFAAYRVVGEWFQLCAELSEIIAEHSVAQPDIEPYAGDLASIVRAKIATFCRNRRMSPSRLAMISGLHANTLRNFRSPNWNPQSRTVIAIEKAMEDFTTPIPPRSDSGPIAFRLNGTLNHGQQNTAWGCGLAHWSAR